MRHLVNGEERKHRLLLGNYWQLEKNSQLSSGYDSIKSGSRLLSEAHRHGPEMI